MSNATTPEETARILAKRLTARERAAVCEWGANNAAVRAQVEQLYNSADEEERCGLGFGGFDILVEAVVQITKEAQ